MNERYNQFKNHLSEKYEQLEKIREQIEYLLYKEKQLKNDIEIGVLLLSKWKLKLQKQNQ